MFSVGIIGAGIISTYHIPAIVTHPDTKLVAVADIQEDRAYLATQPYGAKIYTDYVQMLDNENLDIAIINLPHALHEPCAIACAMHGVHILLEKPMSISSESCERIIRVCKDNQVLLQIGHVQRYRPECIAARNIITSGELGKLIMINEINTVDYFSPSRPKWFTMKEMAGGGISINYGVHSLDRLSYLSGSPIASVVGKCTYDSKISDVDGSAQFIATTENDITCCVTLCGYPCAQEECVMVYLSKGVLRIRPNVDLCQYINGEYIPIDLGTHPDMFISQWHYFIEGVKRGSILHYSGEQGMKFIKLIESIW